MDREFALRLVVFHYLLPQQRASRARHLDRVFRDAGENWGDEETTLEGMMERLSLLSDKLLTSRGYPTSFDYVPLRDTYVYPVLPVFRLLSPYAAALLDPYLSRTAIRRRRWLPRALFT